MNTTSFIVGFVLAASILVVIVMTLQYVVIPWHDKRLRMAAEGTAADRAEQSALELASVLAAFAMLPRRAVTEHETAAECPICMSGYQESEQIVTLACAHSVHVGCMEQWISKDSRRGGACVICQQPLVTLSANGASPSGTVADSSAAAAATSGLVSTLWGRLRPRSAVASASDQQNGGVEIEGVQVGRRDQPPP